MKIPVRKLASSKAQAFFLGTMLLLVFYISIWYVINPFISTMLSEYLPFASAFIKDFGGLGKLARFLCYSTAVMGIMAFGMQIYQKNFIYRKAWIPYLLPLGILLLLAGVSTRWSVRPNITETRFIYFFVVSMLGLFIGFNYRGEKILDMFSLFFAIIILTSLYAAYFTDFGIHSDVWNFHFKSWRGIFNFKNTLGSFMSLGNVFFLYLLLTSSRARWWKRIYYVIFYGLTIFLIYRSGSAGAIVTLVLTTSILLVILALVKWGHLIKPVYWVFLGIAFLGGLAFIWNSKESILERLGKGTDLTYRIPNWLALLEIFVPKRPFFGYGGFGAFWESDLKNVLQEPVNWIPNHAHNGYIEMLLGLGVVGFISFLVVFLENILLGIKNLYKVRSNHVVWPILFFLHFSVVNLVYSLIGRIETFFWFAFVITLAYSIRITFDPEQGTDVGTAPVLK